MKEVLESRRVDNSKVEFSEKDYIKNSLEYLQKNQIYEFFDDLMQKLILRQPADPIDFLMKEINKPRRLRLLIIFSQNQKYFSKFYEAIASKYQIPVIYRGGDTKETNDTKGDTTQVIAKTIAKLKENDTGFLLVDFPSTKTEAISLLEGGVEFDRILMFNSDGGEKGEQETGDSKTDNMIGVHHILRDSIYQLAVSSETTPDQILAHCERILPYNPSAALPIHRKHQVCILGNVDRTELSQRLAQHFDLVHINISKLALETSRKDPHNEIASKILPKMDSSLPIDNSVLCPIVQKRLGDKDCIAKGWILDGFPKDEEQLKFLSDIRKNPTKIVFLTNGKDSEDVAAFLRTGKQLFPCCEVTSIDGKDCPSSQTYMSVLKFIENVPSYQSNELLR